MGRSSDNQRWATKYPELGTGALEIKPYISLDHFAQEREKIFKRSWLNVARVDEIRQAGDYLVKELTVCNTSILIVRGKDGVIRGFHNVCAHRGNKVAKACAGSVRSFVCGFHGWTYDLAGQLVSVPDEGQFFGLKKDEHSLASVATDVWEGFVFVNLDPRPKETLHEFMGELGEDLSGYPFGAMTRVVTYSTEVNANWKLIVDIGQESYHFPFVHRRSIPDSYTSRENPYAHFLSIRLYDRHRLASVYANPGHQPTPAEGLAFKFGFTVVQQTSEVDVLPKGVNPERSSTWGFDLPIIFPNSIISLGNGFYVMDRYWPITVDRTLWESTLHMSEANNAGQRISQEFSKVFTRDLAREDLAALERVQSGLASGVLNQMQLSDQEILVRHSHQVIKDILSSN